jgi:ferredoxin, 2Fe-2S
MPRVTFVQPDGERRVVEVPVGVSVMKAAVNNGVPGIVAECGGSCMCATCHVYVATQAHPLPPLSADEDEMLDVAAAERRPTSRLSCQLVLTDDLDELVVDVPETQS